MRRVVVVQRDRGHQRVERDGAGVVGDDQRAARVRHVLQAGGLDPEPRPVQRPQQREDDVVGEVGVEAELVDLVVAGQPAAQERQRVRQGGLPPGRELAGLGAGSAALRSPGRPRSASGRPPGPASACARRRPLGRRPASAARRRSRPTCARPADGVPARARVGVASGTGAHASASGDRAAGRRVARRGSARRRLRAGRAARRGVAGVQRDDLRAVGVGRCGASSGPSAVMPGSRARRPAVRRRAPRGRPAVPPRLDPLAPEPAGAARGRARSRRRPATVVQRGVKPNSVAQPGGVHDPAEVEQAQLLRGERRDPGAWRAPARPARRRAGGTGSGTRPARRMACDSRSTPAAATLTTPGAVARHGAVQDRERVVLVQQLQPGVVARGPWAPPGARSSG